MSISSISPTTYYTNPCDAPVAGGSRRPTSAPNDVRADDADVRASVGALGDYAAGFTASPATIASQTSLAALTIPAAPAAPGTPTDSIASLPPLTSGTGSSSSPFAPARTWASMVGQSGPGGAVAGSAADQGMSQILDDGDVFGADAD